MKNNKILSLGLFREGRSQLRAVGIAYICISALMAVFCCLSYIDDLFDPHYSYSALSPFSGSMEIVASIGIYIVLPVMTLMMFNFLNSRSAADFYHSIPRTRTQTVLSFSLSIVFWFFLGIAASVVTELVVGLICGTSVAWGQLGIYFLNLMVVYIQFYGILLLAVSIATGVLNQIAAAGIIAFLPRIMLIIMGQISEEAAPVLMGLNDVLGKFGESEINLLFNNEIFTGINILENTDYVTLIYSVALGVIYGTLGVVCFCRRKSEAATTAGANKYVQCGIRVLVAFVVCLIPCYSLGGMFISAESTIELIEELVSFIPTMFLIYGIAIVVYFLYEAITAKRIKGVVTLKGTMGIGLLILIALNAAFILAPTAIAKVSLATEISTGNVESVSLYSSDSTYYETNYQLLEIDEIEFTDEEMIELLCKALEKDIEVIGAGDYSGYFYRQNMASMAITFNMKDGRKLDRKVYMHVDDYYAVNDIMFSDDAYYELLRTVPPIEEVNNCYNYNSQLGDKELKVLYKTLYDELCAMEDEDYFFYIMPDSEDAQKDNLYYQTAVDYVNVGGVKEGLKWYNSYPINKFVPETYKRYIELINEMNRNKGEDVARIFKNSEEANIEITIIYTEADAVEGSYSESFSISFTEDKPSEQAIERMKYIGEHWDDPVDPEKTICLIDYFIDDYDSDSNDIPEYTWISGRHFIPGDGFVELIENAA